MANARGSMSRSESTAKGGGKLNRDDSQREQSGFMSGGGKPQEWEGRTGYTKENRIGASPKGTKIDLP